MKFITAVGTAILGATLLSGSALSAKIQSITPPSLKHDTTGSVFAKIFENTTAPIGYINFCARGEQECQFKAGKVERIALGTEQIDQLNQVNTYVNTKIKPISDVELYGVPDYWTYPINAGDCEDYVLLKKRYLQGLGYSADELLITVVLDENGAGHAILTVMTDQGDMILDNRRNEILNWNKTGYKFLKRQSQADATVWVSLQQNSPQVLVSSQSN
jgi:predicted transglutaminase-like cysteine proteinase